MIWLVSTLLQRNLSKYVFLLLGIAACVSILVISSAGNSVLWKEARYPLRFLLGGDIMITNRSLEFTVSKLGNLTMENSSEDIGLNTYLARQELTASLTERFPEGEITSTILVPAILSQDIKFSLLGRVDHSNNPGLRPMISEQDWDLWQNKENAMLFFDINLTDMLLRYSTGNSLGFRIPALHIEDQQLNIGWEAPDVKSVRFSTEARFDKGVLPLPNMGVPWIRGDDEAVIGAWSEWANWLAFSVPVDQLGYEAYIEEMGAFLEENHPELVLYTIDELMYMMAKGFLKLDAFAERYTPLLLFIATLTLAITQLSMINSRQREFAIYQLLGLERARLWLFFLLENLILLILGIAGGVLISGAFCLLFFNGFSIHWPLVFQFSLLALPVSLLVFARTTTSNPTEIMRSR